MSVRAVVFEIDGTLALTDAAAIAAPPEDRRAHRVPPSLAALADHPLQNGDPTW